MKLALVPAAAVAALAIALTPALAQQIGHAAPYHQAQPYRHGTPSFGSDPSFGNRAGIDNARAYGRCVEDLGYGRYEYCD
jgi:hypothetical protein